MKKTRSLLLVACLMVLSMGLMIYFGEKAPATGSMPPLPPVLSTPAHAAGNGGITISGALSQEKVHGNSSHQVAYTLTMTADKEEESGASDDAKNVDMVIVLDRSGSMNGEKIREAKKAILRLVEGLGPRDRFALVTYSNNVMVDRPLSHVTTQSIYQIQAITRKITSQGGTNLAAGLKKGMDILRSSERQNPIGRVVLISDGRANQGITDPAQISRIAAKAISGEFAVSSVGIGQDFNEYLMTSIADSGTGSYYYLEDAHAFAKVFSSEYKNARAVFAKGISVKVPLSEGIRLAAASGYPFDTGRGHALIHLPDMLSGQTKKLILTFELPAGDRESFSLPPISLTHTRLGRIYTNDSRTPFKVARVKSRAAAIASISVPAWEDKVVIEDLNVLKRDVAKDIRLGEKEEAIKKIESFRRKNAEINKSVGSLKVAQSIEKDSADLEAVVEEVFAGKPQAVEAKKRKVSKSMQYGSYRGQKQIDW